MFMSCNFKVKVTVMITRWSVQYSLLGFLDGLLCLGLLGGGLLSGLLGLLGGLLWGSSLGGSLSSNFGYRKDRLDIIH